MLAQAKVYARLSLATTVLNEAGVSYALIGGLAMAAWVRSVDASRVRGTSNVDLLVSVRDVHRSMATLQGADFPYRDGHMWSFGETPMVASQNGVRLRPVERRRVQGAFFEPSVLQRTVMLEGVPTLALEDLVQDKLALDRGTDRIHVRDLVKVGLVDDTWRDRLPAPLDRRLWELMNYPEGWDPTLR